MSNILFISSGEKISAHGELICVYKEEQTYEISPKNIEVVIIETTQISLSSFAMLILSRNKIPLILCNEKHMPEIFCLNLFSHYHLTQRISEQINWHLNDKVILWRQLIKNKILNQQELIKTICGEATSDNKLEGYIYGIDECDTNEGICHLEAISARCYFKSLFGNKFKRHGEDVTNESLNYGYSILRSYISTIVVSKGLHPSLGINHHNVANNFNLVDDLIEIYRPLVDYAVFIKLNHVEKLDKDMKKHLLQVIFQKVFVDDKYKAFKDSVISMIDEIIDYFNSGVLPKQVLLRCDAYEYY